VTSNVQQQAKHVLFLAHNNLNSTSRALEPLLQALLLLLLIQQRLAHRAAVWHSSTKTPTGFGLWGTRCALDFVHVQLMLSNGPKTT
jgi:hypothetical protein